MKHNKVEVIQKKYRKLYLNKIAGFKNEYRGILDIYLEKTRKIAFDHSTGSGKLKKPSINKIKKSINILNSWLKIETENIVSDYILQAVKIALLGQIKALKYYEKNILEENQKSNLAIVKNKYGKEKIIEIKETILNKKWEDGLIIKDRLDKLNKMSNAKTNKITSKAINSNKTSISFHNEIAVWLRSYKNKVLTLTGTETNSAYRRTQKLIGEDSNLVKGIKWNLSPRHPNYDYYEVCEKYAGENHSGLGVGVYKLSMLPGIPHPRCMCYLTFRF